MKDGYIKIGVDYARRGGNIADLTMPTGTLNAFYRQSLKQNKVTIFNCMIFKELLKQLISCLGAKEVMSDMLEAYEEACSEDTALEASFTVFNKRKMLQFVEEKERQEREKKNIRPPQRSGEDLFAHLDKAAPVNRSGEK